MTMPAQLPPSFRASSFYFCCSIHHHACPHRLPRFVRSIRRCSLRAARFCTEGNGGSPTVPGSERKPPRRRRSAPRRLFVRWIDGPRWQERGSRLPQRNGLRAAEVKSLRRSIRHRY